MAHRLSRLVAPDEAELAHSNVSLMPFRLNHNGPASISTYFLVRPDPEEGSTTKISAFRGRSVCGTDVNLPNGYSGRILKVREPIMTTRQPFVPLVKKRRAVTPPPPSLLAGASKRLRRSPRVARMTFSLNDSSPVSVKSFIAEGVELMEDATFSKDEETGDVMEEHVPEPESVESEEDTADVGVQITDPTIDLISIGTFDSFKLWNPDRVPVDTTQDIYLRALREWTGLSKLVRHFLNGNQQFGFKLLEQIHTC